MRWRRSSDKEVVVGRQIRGKPWEPKVSATRIFYVLVTGPVVVLLHAYTKQGQKPRLKEIETAERRMEECSRNDGSADWDPRGPAESKLAARKRKTVSEYIAERRARDTEFAEEFDKLRLARQMKDLREQAGLSQAQLAVRAKARCASPDCRRGREARADRI